MTKMTKVLLWPFKTVYDLIIHIFLGIKFIFSYIKTIIYGCFYVFISSCRFVYLTLTYPFRMIRRKI
jgi:hypothetical protein